MLTPRTAPANLQVMKSKKSTPSPAALARDIRILIEDARCRVATVVNVGLVTLYWQIGKRIHTEILKGTRADYGAKIVASLSRQLAQEYGQGFSEKSLHRMVQFYEVFQQEDIVASLMRQLSWTHFLEIIPIKDALKRDFYAEMCRIEKWSVRTLRHKIGHMLYERTAVAKKPKTVIQREILALREQDQLTPDMVFKDPCNLDFLGLKGSFHEKDIESAIMREMESFILELGTGFTFVARQKRISVDYDDYYIDLLFYHRGLRRLVAIELKMDRFKAEHKGQMELYLRWLDENERKPGEDQPIGLILCAGKSEEHIRLLQLDKSGIRVAEYMTELPPRRVLEKKLHNAIAQARAMLGNDC